MVEPTGVLSDGDDAPDDMSVPALPPGSYTHTHTYVYIYTQTHTHTHTHTYTHTHTHTYNCL